MDDPYRTLSDERMASFGWAAWSRDSAGRLCTPHARFENVAEWVEYVTEETLRGLRVFYPPGPLLMETPDAGGSND